MSRKLLDIDIQILVLRYGIKDVMTGLSRYLEQTPEEIERQLDALRHGPPKSQRRSSKSLTELVTARYDDGSDKFKKIRTLAMSFDNRVFLPTLRETLHFLRRSGSIASKFKSRVDAGPLVLEVLAELPSAELDLLAQHSRSSESDFALLARAIMGDSERR